MAGKTQVILLDRIGRLGSLGDEVSVSAGYARNWLLPQKQAVLATQQMRAEFERQRSELQQRQGEKLAVARERAKRLEGMALSMPVSAGPSGKMYGSVRARELADAFAKTGVEVEKKEILLADAIRELGEYRFVVQLHPEVRVEMNVTLHSSDTEGAELLAEILAEDDEPEPAPPEGAAADAANTEYADSDDRG